MLDIVWFVLACIPIVSGLFLVLLSLKERSRAAVVDMKASHPTPSGPAPRRALASDAAKRP